MIVSNLDRHASSYVNQLIAKEIYFVLINENFNADKSVTVKFTYTTITELLTILNLKKFMYLALSRLKVVTGKEAAFEVA